MGPAAQTPCAGTASEGPGGISTDLARELARRLEVPIAFVSYDSAGKVVLGLEARAEWDARLPTHTVGHLPPFTAGRLPAGQLHRRDPARVDNAVCACTARHQRGPTP